MLVIPLIKIKNGQSLFQIKTDDDAEKLKTSDPVKLATIFRGENFKTIHLSISDNEDSKQKSLEVLQEIITTVDIPVQVNGPFHEPDEFEYLFKIGCSRIVINYKTYKNNDLLKLLLKEFSAAKIIVRINSIGECLYDCNWQSISEFGAIPLALRLKGYGVRRLLCSTFIDENSRSGIDFGRVQHFADTVNLKITFIGGVKGLHDLWNLGNLETYGLDSIILGRTIYSNYFCCEALWRKNEKLLDDLGPTRRI